MSAIGDTLADRFELRARLGSGGLGEVFVARDRRSAREVAVKVLDVAPIPGDRLTRLATVLRAAASVEHPAVVLPRVLIATSESPPFLAGERIAGEDLAALRRRAGPLSWQRALAIVHACTDGLSALAAATGIAHRALKPGNIRVIADDDVRVLDFGIAELGVQPVPADEHGVVAEYRAPEQLAGAPGDASADVFTLGVLLFELTTGVHPFTGPTAFKAARAVLGQRSAPRPAALAPATPLPSQVEALLVRALAPQPSQRFQDVAELARHLALIRRSPGLTPRTSAAPASLDTDDDDPTQHGESLTSAEDRTTIVSLSSAADRGSPPEPREVPPPASTPSSAVDRTAEPEPTKHVDTTEAPTTNQPAVSPIIDRTEPTAALAANPPAVPSTIARSDRTEPLATNPSAVPTTIARADEPERTEVLATNQPATAIAHADEPERSEALATNQPATAIAHADEPERPEALPTTPPAVLEPVEHADETLADRTVPNATPTPTTVDKTVADRIDRAEALPSRPQAAEPTLVLPAAEPASPHRPAPAPRDSSAAMVRSEDDDRTVLMARGARPLAAASPPVARAPLAAPPPAARRSDLFWPALFCLISLGLALVALLIFLRT